MKRSKTSNHGTDKRPNTLHAFYAQPISVSDIWIGGRYVKYAAGKTKALEALTEYEIELFYGNGYEVKIYKQHNCVVV